MPYLSMVSVFGSIVVCYLVLLMLLVMHRVAGTLKAGRQLVRPDRQLKYVSFFICWKPSDGEKH